MQKILSLILLCPLLLLAGCRTSTVAGHVTSDAAGQPEAVTLTATTGNSNATVSVTGTYDLATGGYTTGFIVTLNRPANDLTRDAMRIAGAVENSPTVWVLPNITARDVTHPVFLALRAAGANPGGATVLVFSSTRLP